MSEGSGTRLRMKLRSRARSPAMISEILRSCSFIEMILAGSYIHYCRRTAAGNIVEIFDRDYVRREREILRNEELILCQEERNAT
jgi:hypothetical protein